MHRDRKKPEKNISFSILSFFKRIWDRWFKDKPRKQILCAVIMFLILAAALTAVIAGKNKCKIDNPEYTAELTLIEPTATPIPTLTPTPIPTPEPVNEHEGMKRSFLTGEWVSLEEPEIRPFAVMFNNINVASPQSGIGDADILYEALVEAGITRLMGIYSSIDPDSPTAERLGSIRSARHYFASIASEYDAIYVCYGGTSYAEKKIKKLSIDTINGTGGYGVNSFYRDTSIKAPHNAFADLEGINKGIEKGSMRKELKEEYTTHFNFYDEDTILDGDAAADKIVLSFSGGMQPYFLYNEDEMNYTRYQFDTVHIDYNTSDELKFKNIIIWLVEQRDIDKNGYQTMDFEDADGEGYYITNGKAVPITWKKDESTYFMKFYDGNGDELNINEGKTYIAVFPSRRAEKITIE